MTPATTPKEIEHSSIRTDQFCRQFSLKEIRSATQYFSESCVIGHGGFGKVYKAYVHEGADTVVAIKRRNSMSDQGAPEFRAEIETLSKIRHCNLVSLIGYCNEGVEMALVYEYMPSGTLEDHLHKGKGTLSWLQLLKICIGAARGLEYLHTGTGTRHGIIHRDVKSSNVLLDENLESKLSDFGLAKVGPTNQTRTHVSTRVKGTFGYMDPSYVYTGNLTRKSDVYSFGVVLLEVMCGRPAVDSSLDEDQMGLVPWAQGRIREGKVSHIIDSRLKGQMSSKCLKDFTDIACRCLHDQPNRRPTMTEIVAKLEVILSLQQRLDSSVTEGKLIDKVLLFFSPPKYDSKAINMTSATVPTGKAKVHLDDKDDLQLIHLSGNRTKANLKPFSYNVLATATRNFSDSTCLEDNSGLVFKGWIDERSHAAINPGASTVVAVKRFDEERFQGHREWLAEINIGVRNHPHLVKLIGYCREDDHRLLVYEFMPGGNLGNHLFRKDSTIQSFSWDVRIKVALGAAKGLAYLHSPDVNVIYRDFKSSNILIDFDQNVKLFNLGFTKDGPVDGKSHISTQVMGTYGYAAPEYVATGHLTTRSDIFGFGVVLLEILTGRRCIDSERPQNEQMLVQFAKPYLTSKRTIRKIIDPRIDGQCTSAVIMKAAMLAMKCLSEDPKRRPTADEVVKELEQLQGMQKHA